MGKQALQLELFELEEGYPVSDNESEIRCVNCNTIIRADIGGIILTEAPVNACNLCHSHFCDECAKKVDFKCNQKFCGGNILPEEEEDFEDE